MGQTPEEGVTPMSYFSPLPMGRPPWPAGRGPAAPAWYPPPAMPGAPAWYPAARPPWTPAGPGGPPAAFRAAWHPAAAPHGLYPAPGGGMGPEPARVEWMAVLEPAFSSVLPAIQGFLELSGLLFGHLPDLALRAAEVLGAAPGEPLPERSGLGHIGLFGPAGPDVIDVQPAGGTGAADGEPAAEA